MFDRPVLEKREGRPVFYTEELTVQVTREQTRKVQVGAVTIGGGAPVAIQSMTNTKTEDVAATVEQIRALAAAGCEIVRCAVPTEEAAAAVEKIKEQISIPLVADFHFDYRLAISAIRHGADKIRINPGNIGGAERVRAVVEAAKERGVPIRVGVNSGSLEKELLQTYGGVTAEALVESACRQAALLEDMGYEDLVISIKASDVQLCVQAHELIAQRTDHPLHVGITEAGTVFTGGLKSAVGLGLILAKGIGDTIRVSLSGDPVEEVRAAKTILRTLGLRKAGIEIVSCPTCGRTEIDLIGLAEQTERMLLSMEATLLARGVLPEDRPFKVAVMGCVVNGPGEAREADIGIAGGRGEGLVIRGGKTLRKVPETELLNALREELEQL